MRFRRGLGLVKVECISPIKTTESDWKVHIGLIKTNTYRGGDIDKMKNGNRGRYLFQSACVSSHTEAWHCIKKYGLLSVNLVDSHG